MGGIKLQLLCGVRIELVVGSLPYPGKSGFPIVSPGRGRLIWISNRKPCLDMRQNPSKDTHFPSYGKRSLPKPQNPKTPKPHWQLNHLIIENFSVLVGIKIIRITGPGE